MINQQFSTTPVRVRQVSLWTPWGSQRVTEVAPARTPIAAAAAEPRDPLREKRRIIAALRRRRQS